MALEALVGMLFLLIGFSAVASDQPTLHQVVVGTVRNLPKLREREVLQQVASSWRRRGSFWLAGPTTLETSFEHFPERESWSGGLDITFTLWKWNQKGSALAVSERAGELPHLFDRLLQWEAAGLVRRLVWQIKVQEVKFRFSQRRLEIAKELLETVKRLVAAGELGRRDLLLARGEYLERLMDHDRAEVERVHIHHTYQLLTGFTTLPQKIEEPLSSRESLLPDHPLLAFLQAKVELFRARSHYARFESSTGDQQAFLRIGSRHLKGGEHGFALSLSYPLGASPYNAPNIAEQRRAWIEAEVELGEAERSLKLELEELLHRLHLDRLQLERAREQRELAERQLRLARELFTAGELDLLDLLRLQERAFEALETAELAEIGYRRDVARYNQLVGEIP